jgi:flavin prenyltransferase
MGLRLVIGITGASGSVYASRLLDKLIAHQEMLEEVALIFSHTAKKVWEYELGRTGFDTLPFKQYSPEDLFAPPASGSAEFDAMIICPCSMGTLGRIAGGTANDLISRSADVILKERRKLILVTREAPLSLIHVKNMLHVTEAGAIIYPASPSFYSKPKDLNALLDTVVNRVLGMVGMDLGGYRWGG